MAILLRMPYDVHRGGNYRKEEDLTTFEGFATAVLYCLRGSPGFLLWGGIPCNSFGFMAQSGHQRSEQQPFGNRLRAWVQLGNTLASRFFILAALSVARKGFYAIENPGQSRLIWFPYYRILAQYIPHFKGRW